MAIQDIVGYIFFLREYFDFWYKKPLYFTYTICNMNIKIEDTFCDIVHIVLQNWGPPIVLQ